MAAYDLFYDRVCCAVWVDRHSTAAESYRLAVWSDLCAASAVLGSDECSLAVP